MPDSSRTPSPRDTPTKSKAFRRPFEAYSKAPHYSIAKKVQEQEPTQCQQPRNPSDASAPKGLHDDIGRVPTPPHVHGYGSRAPSPAPPGAQMTSYRVPLLRANSPPPPAPPPHRHVGRDAHLAAQHDDYSLSRQAFAVPEPLGDAGRQSRISSNSSYLRSRSVPRQPSYTAFDERSFHYAALTPRPHSPQPPRPPLDENHHLTPSPLREAMDGVMEQLDQLEGRGGPWEEDASSDLPLDPWSPESFDMMTARPKHKSPQRSRPMTSMGIAHFDEGYETWGADSSQAASHPSPCPPPPPAEPSQLSNYVERMERQFQYLQRPETNSPMPRDSAAMMMPPPLPPLKSPPQERPRSSMGRPALAERKLRTQKSASEVSHSVNRSYTNKTNSTNASSGNQSNTSSSTQSSNRTLWSGASAGGFSSTSAGSLVRTHLRTQSALALRRHHEERPESPFTGVTYTGSSNASGSGPRAPSATGQEDLSAGLGGLVQPKAPRRNIFKKIIESAKTGVASNRVSIAAGSASAVHSARSSPFAWSQPRNTPPVRASTASASSPHPGHGDAAREMGLGGGGGGGGGGNGAVDWVQVRRDVNRSNSLSAIERVERRDRCQMMDFPTLNPVDELYASIEGDEDASGLPVAAPLNYQSINFGHVDKNSRFISEPPPMVTSFTLATTYVCRPYRSEVQRLRAVFTWVAEKIQWEEDFEGEVDTRRVIQTKRGCAHEYAVLVAEMCSAVGLRCEVVRGYLKSPSDVAVLGMRPRPNHWWNAVIVDNEWRVMDCCLASPSHPRRSLYSSAGGNAADVWWFLARPTEVCWTHVPEHHDQQHLVPPVADEVLLNLPCACPAFFRNDIQMVDYNTSATRIEDLEMVHIKLNVASDIELVAEVEAKAFGRDADGDVFESGELLRKRALAQAEWFQGVKRYTIKALLPGDEGQGTLKIYAGKRGLMHSIKDIPHPLALALPIAHTGDNPAYEFVTRHPTPHAQRHDIYVVQPQCQRLALNNTFVFAIRQHPSSRPAGGPSAWEGAGAPTGRPGSALSMQGAASSVSGSETSSAAAGGGGGSKKPAKLAIQTPGGKILRLMRKEERKGIGVGGRGLAADEEMSDGGTWETIIKCSERGLWRGLVLADRTARWCVFAEWVCV